MSLWLPGALKKPLTVNYTNKRRAVTNAIVLHVAASEAATLHGWFNNPRARASSHFYVRRDGTIEQYLPIDRISWAGVNSDARAVSVETQGMGSGQWTPEQVSSLLKVISFVRSAYPEIPLRTMTSSKRSEAGIGYHRLGVPGSALDKTLRRSLTGGELWSSAVGKVCPGFDRIKQVPDIVKRARSGTAGPVKVKPASPTGYGVDVKTVQRQLQAAGYYKAGKIDDDYGGMTTDAVLAYQRAQRYYPGLLADGRWGPLTQAHYVWVKKLQRAVNKWATAGRLGKVKIDGDYGPFMDRLVKTTIKDNFRGTYTKAVRAEYGRLARPVNDGLPGPVFCRMVGVPAHPMAKK